MSTFWIGIDPGLHGGLVVLDENLVYKSSIRTPIIEGSAGAKAQYDERTLGAVVQNLVSMYGQDGNTARFCIEDVAAAPGQGVVSMFRFGVGYGLWLGAIAATSSPCHKIKPQAWQRVAFAGRPSIDKKQTSFLVARELFPMMPVRSKSADSGLTDAALIAMSCARIYSPKK